MIVCNLKNLVQQVKDDTRMQKAVEFLMKEDLEKLPAGRINIDGDDVYVRVMDYQTIPFEEVKFEAHKKYIDIHYVVAGKEAIWCVDTDNMMPTDEYNPEKDVFHGLPEKIEEISRVILSKGDLAILYPSDAHAPKGMVGSTITLKKIVIKVAQN
jgi:biofilm protein TabA